MASMQCNEQCEIHTIQAASRTRAKASNETKAEKQGCFFALFLSLLRRSHLTRADSHRTILRGWRTLRKGSPEIVH